MSIPSHIGVTATSLQDADQCRAFACVLSRVGDKWSMLVIIQLKDGARRFSELKRAIGGISQRMLTLTLRGLERDGYVTRTMTLTIPPRVDYELTALGHSLRGPVEALGGWAFENRQKVEAARRRFEAAADEPRTDDRAPATVTRPAGHIPAV